MVLELKKKTMIFQRTFFVEKFLRVLTLEGFIYGFRPIFYTEKYISQMKYIQIFLKYYNSERVIQLIASYSKLKLFKYTSIKYFNYLNKFSPFALLHTLNGFQSLHTARRLKIGGSLVFLSL